MNPTLNKKDFEDLSTNLKDLAYGYIEKYSPSKQQLKVYLLKKYLLKILSMILFLKAVEPVDIKANTLLKILSFIIKV